MKVSEKQLLMLVDIAKDTCRMGVVMGGYSPQIRIQLINDILNQQDNTPRQVEEEPPALYPLTHMSYPMSPLTHISDGDTDP